MTLNRPLALLVAAFGFAASGATADESVIVNYQALDRLPPKSSARGVAVPKLTPPGLIGRKRPYHPYRSDPLSNAPAGPGATPPAAFETHETLYNGIDAASEMQIANVFGRSVVYLRTPSGISAATKSPSPAPGTIEVANAGADSEPVFVSWNRARTIGEVYFQADGDDTGDIERSSISALNELASRIGHSQTRVLLRAFGGAAGDSSHEAHKVALRRGLAVRKYLMARGVPSMFIDVTAMGGATDGGPPDRVDVLAGAS
jgi:outer membrane protein OmpA-like peptidoglycan-associated protein